MNLVWNRFFLRQFNLKTNETIYKTNEFIEAKNNVADVCLPVRPAVPRHKGDRLRPEHATAERKEDLGGPVGTQAP